MAPRTSPSAAARALAERDLVLAKLVDAAGMPKLRPSHDTHFAALLRSVLYQQLAGTAAAAIHARLIDALDGEVDPDTFMALSPETLRAVGLSRNKALSLCDLADKISSGAVDLDPKVLRRQSDEQVIATLSQIRGIGRWTAQMFLLFQLRRLDIWPAGDFGVRRGYSLAWGIEMPTERQLEPLGDAFAPYRSIAAWYCWRACEIYK